MSKLIEVYGVQMTELENMKFSKYIVNSGVAMNTLEAEERTELATSWLGAQRADSPFDVMIDSKGLPKDMVLAPIRSEC
jgi:hypothetical protein